MDNPFSANMSFEEAQFAFFQAIEGKTKAEIEKIKALFEKHIPLITKRELEMSKKGWL